MKFASALIRQRARARQDSFATLQQRRPSSSPWPMPFSVPSPPARERNIYTHIKKKNYYSNGLYGISQHRLSVLFTFTSRRRIKYVHVRCMNHDLRIDMRFTTHLRFAYVDRPVLCSKGSPQTLLNPGEDQLDRILFDFDSQIQIARQGLFRK